MLGQRGWGARKGNLSGGMIHFADDDDDDDDDDAADDELMHYVHDADDELMPYASDALIRYGHDA